MAKKEKATEPKKEIRQEAQADIAQEAQKAQKTIKKATENPAEKKPEEINRTMLLFSFLIDYMRDPEDALLTGIIHNETEKYYPQWAQRHFLRLVEQVAAETGADPDQIANEKTRTPEQQRALTEAAGKEQIDRIDAFLNSNYSQAINEVLPIEIKAAGGAEDAAAMIREFAVIYFFALNAPEILPYKPQELTRQQLKEIKDILARFDAFLTENGIAPDRLTGTAADNADNLQGLKQALNEFIENDSKDPERVKKNLPQIFGKIAEKITQPLDKVDRNIWGMLDNAARENGQIAFATEKRGSKKPATVLYSLNFDELEESAGITTTKNLKNLTPFDELVYMACYALYLENGEFITVGQIYRQMGGKGRPGANDIKKIMTALTKMGSGRLFMDNTNEIVTNKKYPHFKYNGHFLAFEAIEAYINGAYSESAIHFIGRMPFPLMTFAKGRGQITTYNRNLLYADMSNTDANLRIKFYLLQEISVMKRNAKYSRKMTYSKIFEQCHITTKKQKQRAPEKLHKLLDFYKSEKAEQWIKDYKEDKTGIIIIL